MKDFRDATIGAIVMGSLTFTALMAVFFIGFGIVQAMNSSWTGIVVGFTGASVMVAAFSFILYGPTLVKQKLPEHSFTFGRSMARLHENGDKDPHPIIRAIDIAQRYGQIDGSHHKAWVIDQMVRTLLGDEVYSLFVAKYQTPFLNEETNEMDYYEWDVGIASPLSN